MCFKTKLPPVPKVDPAPTRADAAGAEDDQRRRLRRQQGAYGNIFTSALGDTNYGSAARRVAALGGGVPGAA